LTDAAGAATTPSAADRASPTELPRSRERTLLALLAIVQVTHIMDFMVLMPLGPQLMRVLAISPQQFGLLVSAYTFAAGASGALAAFFVDRFDRRTALLVIYGGFGASTLLCALAPGYEALLAARIVSGLFGGIAGAMVQTIVGDVIPESRRGRASGVIASAFSLSSVAGVPVGLFLANHFGWNAPFAFIAALSLPLWIAIARVVPPLDRHLRDRRAAAHSPVALLRDVFGSSNHRAAFMLTGCLMFAGFSVIPFISPYSVKNVGLAETDLPTLYFFGGLATLFTARLVGRFADRFGKRRTFRAIACASMLPLLVTTHLPPVPVWIAICSTVLFMVLVSGRFIPLMALVTSSVEPRLRGAFLAFNASIQQLFAGAAAFGAGLVIGHGPAGELVRFGTVGWIAVGFTALCIVLAGRVKTPLEP
jgi:predicted MFS family arabinose efflux permease